VREDFVLETVHWDAGTPGSCLALRERGAPVADRLEACGSAADPERTSIMTTTPVLGSTDATTPVERIRDFCIIAHIDHGKSTLADRLIEYTRTVPERDMRAQLLDDMDIERERGITAKLQTVRMFHTGPDGLGYQLNLIDTPGHVDFTAEVMRSLAACDGAILLVDATQGVQAQTLANLRLARRQGLVILPVINKVDSPLADVDRVLVQLAELDGVDIGQALLVSAKTGQGIPELLEAIVTALPAPLGDLDAPVRALVFDSHYDPFRGL
jgi:GTP-binding protein LepA